MVVVRKYTLSSLINKLIEFEELFKKRILELGYSGDSKELDMLGEELRELKDFIIVEMTLEPIYTVDPVQLLNQGTWSSPDELIRFRSKVYAEVSKAVEHVSGELADLLRKYITD